MYTLTESVLDGLQYLELASADGRSRAQLCLDQGGRLSQFLFENIQVLTHFDASRYKDNYASAILFPFANRIKDGIYTFENLKYELHCNEADKNNALHGLVYNKTFVCINKVLEADYASVTLQYSSDGKTRGYPFKFNIESTYTLCESGLVLSIIVKNKDKKTIPFNLGWHPYFYTTDLDKSILNFNSTITYEYDNQQIISGTTPLDIKMPLQLNGIKLDNGYRLESNEIEFSTPEYDLNIKSTATTNFLQLYTPNQSNTIAIEPMIGAANNFNNKIGLQTLKPNETYKVKWYMAIETLATNKNKPINH